MGGMIYVYVYDCVCVCYDVCGYDMCVMIVGGL